MSTAYDRVPEVAGAVLTALATRSDGLPVQLVAQVIGEEPYVTGLACRSLRHSAQVSWDRQPGSRQWLVRPLATSRPIRPAVTFAEFAREMGFRGEDVSLVGSERVSS